MGRISDVTLDYGLLRPITIRVMIGVGSLLLITVFTVCYEKGSHGFVLALSAISDFFFKTNSVTRYT